MSSFDPPLPNKDLVDLLMMHGIVCNTSDEQTLLERAIETVGYYRLEEYTWSFRKRVSADSPLRTAYFKQKTRFSLVWNYYLFDRRLRILLIDAIERFEVALRCAITQLLTDETGSNTPHADISLFPAMNAVDKKTGKTRHEKWLATIQSKYNDSGAYDPRVEHCKKAHGITDIRDLPIWIVMEMTTFGDLKKLYEGLAPALRTKLSLLFGVDEDFLTSSLILLHQVRNRCAHHKRVWNYLWLKKTRYERPLFMHRLGEPEWYYRYDCASASWVGSSATTIESFRRKDTAFIFILCGFWLKKIAQTSHWKERVEKVVQPSGCLLKVAEQAGFPIGWEKHPLWKNE